MKKHIIILVLLLCGIISSCEKKYGEAFQADFQIKSKSEITSVKVFKSMKESTVYYYNDSPVNTPIDGYFKFKTSGVLNFDNNESVVFKIKLKDNKTECEVSSQGRKSSKTTIDGNIEIGFTMLTD